jgi:hypothetical protein
MVRHALDHGAADAADHVDCASRRRVGVRHEKTAAAGAGRFKVVRAEDQKAGLRTGGGGGSGQPGGGRCQSATQPLTNSPMTRLMLPGWPQRSTGSAPRYAWA